ncbi:fumarylacetoacetate hydrolase family protein [Haloactinomyces albus]|uniref:2-keto-4-pentenoate hydratase/2-oxohepta-3-ene-1,7-dioic acid hydratase in catechol pathway n=1 Tax=Haloactinomyces albus TaxID=1352928 RepID=A0AAE4CKX9_9ACTN|nr:fumarylacetoacetate hydrolase family protein [Haloactinomyces albus]MDR7301615.1 2-keto-4-pentenoate hydratase/2-oxohepta-3-ene-1,7-dioic acid hydratase in catechol pathway [Haloactinomyces albus]
MRLTSDAGRLCLQEGIELVDVATASEGRFTADPQAIYPRWAEFRSWAAARTPAGPPVAPPAQAGAPAPRPGQSIGIGVNYADHAAEAAIDLPAAPVVFPKFSSCIAAPSAALILSGDRVDWEVELVVVIGATARNVAEVHAWEYVAGLTIGQDISDRGLQFAGSPPQQFGIGKSLPGFGPIGPWLVTPDELADPDDLEIICMLNGEIVQHSHTKHLIFGVSALIAYLSRHLTLNPGDVLFTGTPAGVGFGREPAVYLRPGDELVSRIEGMGELVTRVVTGAGHGR